MKVEYINPFLTATISAFQTMLGCTLTRGAIYIKNGSRPEHEVSGMIGLSGEAQGTVVLSMSCEAAVNVAETLLGERPDGIDEDVTDAVGELTNIIAGGAKAQLEHLHLSVSLPTVVTGKHHCIQFPKEVAPICIPFDSGLGSVVVEFGLTAHDTAPADKSSQAPGGTAAA